jgi:hypothetical protein
MNPFQSAEIISVDTETAVYVRQDAKRGDRDFIMSRSELAAFAACPHKWRHSEGWNEDTASTKWGSLIDCLALQPNRFRDLYAVAPETYPDTKTGEPKEWNWNANFCKDWRAKQGNREVIKQPDVIAGEDALSVLHKDTNASDLLLSSDRQVFVMAQYHDKETGINVAVKALIDLVPKKSHAFFGKCLADLKTARTADPRKWSRVVFDSGYDMQAALYLDAYVAATKEDRTDWLHLIQENTHPYELGRRLLSSEFVEIGRQRYVSALRAYARCLKDNHWPGYDERSRFAISGWTITEPEPWMVLKPEDWHTAQLPIESAEEEEEELIP